MNPVNREGCIFDASAGSGIVLYDFSATSVSVLIDLIEDGRSVFCNSDVVLGDKVPDGIAAEEGAEESDKIAGMVTDGRAVQKTRGKIVLPHMSDGGRGLRRCRLVFEQIGGLAPGIAPALFRMILKVVLGSVVVGAGGFVIAAADIGSKDFSHVVDVRDETLFATALGTDEAAGRAGIFGQMVGVFHGLFCFGLFLDGIEGDFVGFGVDKALSACFVEFAFDSGGGHPGFAGNFADGASFVAQAGDFLQVFHFGQGVVGAKVFLFRGWFQVFEVGKGVGLFQAIECNMVGAPNEFAGADLDLFDIAKLGVFG